MYEYWFLFVTIVVVHGFLLKPDSGEQSNAQYLTVSEFLDEKRQQQHDLDRTLTLLTTQIEQKFTYLAHKIGDNGSDTFKQNYLELADNYTKLQAKFEAYAAQNELLKTELADNYTKLQATFEATTAQYARQKVEMTDHYTKLEAKFEALISQYTVQKNELDLLKNGTISMQADIKDLTNLKNIQPLVDLQTLRQQMQSVSVQTHMLSVNEQARNQDFLALYNETLFSKKRITDIEAQNSNIQNETILSKRKIADIEGQTKALQNHDNEQAAKIDVLNKTVQAVVFNDNKTFSQIQNKMDTITERVAIAGCFHSSNTEPVGYIIQFSDIQHHVGISNISIFQSTGKFTCEKEGLYLISVTVTTNTGSNYGAYSVYRNGISITSRAVHTNYGYGSVSASITLELNLSDTVWVQSDHNMYIVAPYSCLSIVKIK